MNLIQSLLFALLFAIATPAVSAESVNINTASVEQLTALDGIGEVKARAIVEHRDANGRFRSVDQLEDVKGVGPKTVEKNRDRIRIDGAP